MPDETRSPFGEFVLIVEPDRQRANAYRTVSQDAGFIPVACRDGAEAMSVVQRRGAPVLVIAELVLPRLDGFELLDRVRRHAEPAAVPAIVTSAFKDFRTVAERMQDRLGVAEVLPRDAPAEQIKTAVTRALANVHARPSAPRAAAARRPIGKPSPEHSRRAVSVAMRAAARHGIPVAAVYMKTNGDETFSVNMLTHEPRAEVTSTVEWSVVQQVVDAGQPLIVADLQRHPVFDRDRGARDRLLRGMAVVPIDAADGRVRGAVAVGDFKPLSLTASDVDYLGRLGARLRLAPGDRRDAAPQLGTGDRAVTTVERNAAPPTGTPPAGRAPTARRPVPVATEPPHRSVATLLRMALTDPLTDLANRRGGEESILREVARARRNSTPLSCVLLDIDHFKRINDEEGHAAGDEVLRQVSQVLLASVRGSDLAIRWGGEEFLLVLPEVDLEGARNLAERIRRTVERLGRSTGNGVTISAGVAAMNTGGTIADSFAEADKRLYLAKAAGRNRVV